MAQKLREELSAEAEQARVVAVTALQTELTEQHSAALSASASEHTEAARTALQSSEVDVEAAVAAAAREAARASEAEAAAAEAVAAATQHAAAEGAVMVAQMEAAHSATLEATMEHAATEKSALEVEVQAARSAVAAAETDCQAYKATVESNTARVIAAATTLKAHLELQLGEALAATAGVMEQNVVMEVQNATVLQDMSEQHSKVLRNMERQHDAAMQVLRRKLESHREGEAEAAIAALTKQHDMAVSALSQGHQEEHDLAAQTLRGELSAEVEMARVAAVAEVQVELGGEHNAALSAMASEHDAVMQSLRRELEEQRTEHQAAIAALPAVAEQGATESQEVSLPRSVALPAAAVAGDSAEIDRLQECLHTLRRACTVILSDQASSHAIGLPAVADQPLRPPRASGKGEDPAVFLQRRVHFVAARLSELEDRSAAASGSKGAAERQAPDQPLHESFRAGLVSAHLQRFASVLQLRGVLSWTDLEVTDVDELLGELSATGGVKKLEAKRFRRLCDHARTSGSAAPFVG
jgi:hypothetical protein